MELSRLHAAADTRGIGIHVLAAYRGRHSRVSGTSGTNLVTNSWVIGMFDTDLNIGWLGRSCDRILLKRDGIA
jgi:hypothetical protein